MSERAKRAGGPARGTVPLLSACMITRDEEANLGDCLTALNFLVDEVVVYDTGSTDGTVELARRLGATVLEGYWDDDFSRARNQALAACKGTWILHVDADEVLEADARVLRGVLEADPPADAFTIEIYNLIGDGSRPGYTHRGVRLFRRRRCHWEGPLHEQVVLRPGHPGVVRIGALPHGRLVHSGYLETTIADHDKLERNLRVALAARDQGPSDGSEAALRALNLGRCLAAVGRFEEALEQYRTAADGLEVVVARRMACMHAAEATLELRRPEVTLEWVDRLRGCTTRPAIPDVLEAQARVLLADPGRAVELLEGVGGEAADEDGFALPSGLVETLLANALLEAGRADDAADVLLQLVERIGDALTVANTVQTLGRAGRSLEVLARSLPERHLIRAAAALTMILPDDADRAAEELWGRFDGRPELLAAAVRFGPKLPPSRALVWSARLRAVGAAERCPLLERAQSHPDPAERALAAATAVVAFADPAAERTLADAVIAVPAAGRDLLRRQLAEIGVATAAPQPTMAVGR